MIYSFVLIAYNESDNIVACIESILAQSALGNSYEIVVVDDGSTDNTRELVTNLTDSNDCIRLIGDGKNHGRGYGRHAGVTASQGEYVIMVDADIVLPRDWLVRSVKALDVYDVAGGIAVPDGDVAYVYRRFGLQPKTVMGSTTITGNNGIYKRAVFDTVNFDMHLREGEDVDFNNRAIKLGVREFTIPGLTVEHHEHKTFGRSMLWLYQSGIGATRQLHRFREIRLPDLAFAATVTTFVLASVVWLIEGTMLGYIVPVLGLAGASFMHLKGKFGLESRQLAAFAMAVLTDMVLIACYYVGRLAAYPRAVVTRSL